MSDHNHETDGNPGWWIARPENANKVWYALVFTCVGLVLADLIYHNFYHAKHGNFAFETIIGFHGFYGFVGLASNETDQEIFVIRPCCWEVVAPSGVSQGPGLTQFLKDKSGHAPAEILVEKLGGGP